MPPQMHEHYREPFYAMEKSIMRNLSMLAAAATFITFGSAHEAKAVDPEACAGALVKTQIDEGSVTMLDWRRSFALDETSWQSASQKFGATVPVYGIPVQGSYADYKKSRDDRSVREGQSLDKRTATWLISSDLGDRAADAYKACLKALGRDAGVSVYPTKVSTCGFTLNVEYNKGRFGPEEVPLEFSMVPASAPLPKNLPASIGSAGQFQAGMERPHAGELRIVVRSPQYFLTDDLVMTPLLLRWQPHH